MYGSQSPAATKDLNLTFSRRKEESELQRQQQMSSGMLRYRSAPSSLLGEVCENFLPVRPSSPETESIFARFLSQDLRDEIREKPAAGDTNSHFKLSPEFSVAPPQMLYHEPSLIRHSSSPAGFFDNGYGLMRGMAGGGAKGQISFSSRRNSLSQISEMGSDGMSGDEQSPVESSNGRCFMPSYPVSSWEDSLISDSFSGFKRSRDVVGGGLNQHDLQDGDVKNQFGLPKSSSEMAAIEKFLQFQDSVPCKIRAKRGCATHPRSIAERMRRTRISERMRKLQELVPNMDKQTNTADMLDLAVEYIKDLQKQAKTLTDGKAACTCSESKQKPYHNLTS